MINDIVLASASPRRREILDGMGLKYTVKPADIDEDAIAIADPCELVKTLSRAKAEAVFCKFCDSTVIAADTVVYLDKVYGKPHDFANAVAMLKQLQGKWHTVYTGVTVINSRASVTFFDASTVKFKELSDKQIEDYVRDCKPFDKAGAYGIQDKRIVEKYEGSYTNIVGLPKEKLADALGELGVIDVDDRIIH